MRYRCNVCGASFTEPKEVIETHGFDHPPYERWEVCPFCREANFDEIEEEVEA